ncbi:PTS sugar transporter subunit IIB, partial [Enterococcus avium]
VGSIGDAYQLIKEVPEITRLNLGGTKAREGTKNISKAINVLPDEEKQLKELAASGINLEIQQVPTDTVINYK